MMREKIKCVIYAVREWSLNAKKMEFSYKVFYVWRENYDTGYRKDAYSIRKLEYCTI